jgi:hypothetical protein
LLGARQYNPVTGRFLSLDPILEVGDPTQMGGYSYAADNPASNEDPNGMTCTAGQNVGNCYQQGAKCQTDPSFCATSGGGGDNSGSQPVTVGPVDLPPSYPHAARLQAEYYDALQRLFNGGNGSLVEEWGALVAVCGWTSSACGTGLFNLLVGAGVYGMLWSALAAVGPGALPDRDSFPDGMPATDEPGTVLTPYEKGELATQWSVDAALSRGDALVGTEVDLTFTIDGKSVGVRADALVQTSDGQYVYIESKYSPAASYTTNQSIAIPALVRAGDEGLIATVGARSGLLSPGDQIPVIFQGDVWNSGPTLYGG